MKKMHKIKEGFTRVKTCDGKIGTIESNLSAQVTVEFEDGSFEFLLKGDYPHIWTIITTEDNNNERTRNGMLRSQRIHRLKRRRVLR
jgi:hypothetical protein